MSIEFRPARCPGTSEDIHIPTAQEIIDFETYFQKVSLRKKELSAKGY